jgi:hypothetical protein
MTTHRERRHGFLVVVMIAAGTWFFAATAGAQTQLAQPQPRASIGFLVPVYFNPEFNTGQDESDSGRRSAVGMWGEFIAFASSRVAFHTGVEFPTSTTVNATHHGTAGFTSVLSSRQVAVYEMVGFHSAGASTMQATGLVGFGLVMAQFTDQHTDSRPGLPSSPTSTFKYTQYVPSIMGGIEVPIRISESVALVGQLRGRVLLRKGLGLGPPTGEMFGWFSFTPGIGIQFRSRP